MDYRQPIEPEIIVLVAAGALSFRRAEVPDLLPAEPALAEDRD
jgi:hypothetical protein